MPIFGVDDARSWIKTNELNVFTWLGPDVRPVSRAGEKRRFAYGLLPRNMIVDLIANVRARVREGIATPVQPDEPLKARAKDRDRDR